MMNGEIKQSKQILKNLNAVLNFSIERYQNMFEWQEVELKPDFKRSFKAFLEERGNSITFFKNTSIVTTNGDQYIFIANQWFAIGSFFVDFCTELLTYKSFFDRICNQLHISGPNAQSYAINLKGNPSESEKNTFCSLAHNIFLSDFSDDEQSISTAVSYLWRFVNDYSWWSGSKYISRTNDFYHSPLLSSMNVVNANSEYLAKIVYYFASDLELRLMVESLDGFIIDPKIKTYTPSEKEMHSYNEAEMIIERKPTWGNNENPSISISAASLQRFQSKRR